MPFPNGAVGKSWNCGAAKQGTPPNNNGQYGFFSLVMNIDLKKSDSAGVTGPNFAYPAMPLLSQFSQPTRTVLMFDTAFDPVTEVVNTSPGFNSVNPANRWRSFAVRHGGVSGNIAFLDGHAATINTNNILPQQGNGNERLGVDVIWNALYRDANP
jgi:prepilin-type processing-associated H-X9-DG protein